MKKLILAIGASAMMFGTSAMAVQQSEIEEVLGLMSLKDGQPHGCLGYGAGIVEMGGDSHLTLAYSNHGHKLTTTCIFPAPPEYEHGQDLSGKGYLCLLANEGDGKDRFKYTIRSSFTLTEDAIVMKCVFKSFRPFPHADD